MNESKDLALSILCKWRAVECNQVTTQSTSCKTEKTECGKSVGQIIKKKINRYKKGE